MSEMTLKAVVMLRQLMHCFKLEKKGKKSSPSEDHPTFQTKTGQYVLLQCSQRS